MQESPFTRFLDLINLDQRIEALSKECQSYQNQLYSLQQNVEQARTVVRQAQELSAHAQKEVNALELEMKTLEASLKDKKKRLESVANHKEYQSIQQEIERIEKKQHNLEDGLLSAWHALEGQQRVQGSQEQSLQDTKERADQEQQKLMSNAQSIQESMQQLIAQRAEKERAVPAEWLEKYRMMRSQVPDPVVPVVQGSCSACFYKVLEQDLILLKHKKLLQCKDCYRFLYIEEPGS